MCVPLCHQITDSLHLLFLFVVFLLHDISYVKPDLVLLVFNFQFLPSGLPSTANETFFMITVIIIIIIIIIIDIRIEYSSVELYTPDSKCILIASTSIPLSRVFTKAGVINNVFGSRSKVPSLWCTPLYLY
jgi:hypothetical protein